MISWDSKKKKKIAAKNSDFFGQFKEFDTEKYSYRNDKKT